MIRNLFCMVFRCRRTLKLEYVTPLQHLSLKQCYHCGGVHRSTNSDHFRKKRRKMREEEAEKVLNNLSEELKEKYHKIKVELDILAVSNFKAPEPERISAHEWMYMLHSIDTERDRKNYLLTLGLRQRNKEKPSETLVDRIVEEGVYNTKSSTRKEEFRKARAVQGLLLGNPFVLDLDYDMPESEERRVLSMFLQCYSAHTQHVQPFRLIVTGLKNKHLFQRELEPGGSLEFLLAEFHDDSFTDLFPKEELVYLTPDARYGQEYKGDAVHVIGGLSQRQENKLRSVSKAKSLQIQAVGLPIKWHVKMVSNRGHDLPMDTVYRVMLDVNLHHSWRKALVTNLPPDKYSPLRETRTVYYEAGDNIVIND